MNFVRIEAIKRDAHFDAEKSRFQGKRCPKGHFLGDLPQERFVARSLCEIISQNSPLPRKEEHTSFRSMFYQQ